MEKIINVVDDNGYYAHKLAYFDNKRIQTLKIPSIVGSADQAVTSTGGHHVDMYQTEGGLFVCNPAIQKPIPVRTNDYNTSPLNRVLVHHGMMRAGLSGAKVRLATALPVRDYFLNGGGRNEEKIRGQHENMMKPVYMPGSNGEQGKSTVEVVKHSVYAECVSAAVDFLLDDEGNERFSIDQLFAPIAVWDFGGSTFDVVALNPDFSILQGNSGTTQKGTYDIRTNLEGLLKERLKKETGSSFDRIPSWLYESAFTKGVVPVTAGGTMKNIEVRDIVLEAAKPVVSEIRQFASQTLGGDFLSYQFNILVGGGALLCRELFEGIASNIVVLDEFANAKGMLKYMTYLDSDDTRPSDYAA